MTGCRPERRKYPRFEISFPITFRLFHGGSLSGDAHSIEAIGTRTQGRVGNVSLEGLFIEANPTEDQISEIMRAKREEDQFDIEIEARLMGENLSLMGRVVWYDIVLLQRGSSHFRAGAFLGDMDAQTQAVWNGFIGSLQH